MRNLNTFPQLTKKYNYLNHRQSLSSWLLTKDHKRIALLYLAAISLFLILGGALAGLLRLELMSPGNNFVTLDTYKKVYTMHGFAMIFFGLALGVPAILGNFLIPLMIGARNLAFPRLNLFSWYLYLLAGGLMLAAISTGGVATGWIFFAPYSNAVSATPVLLTGLSLILVSLSAILLAINFVVSVHKMRAPGLTWFRLPLFVWAIYMTSLITLIATPVLIVTLVLALIDAPLQLGIFNPALGGDPVLFQHLFWFYGHQTIYLISLPALGIIGDIFAAFTRRPIFGYRAVALSFGALAALGFLSWPIHLINSSASPLIVMFGSFFAFVSIIPFSLIILNLIATLYHSQISLSSPMLYALSALGLLIVASLSGVFLSTLSLARYLDNTAFDTANWHYVSATAIMAGLGGLHFWWSKISGKQYPETAAKVTAIILFIATNLSLLPQFIVGYLGMPSRSPYYPVEFTIFQTASTLAASLMMVGYLLPFIYLGWSLLTKSSAPANMWQARGLEWEQTATPPAPDNFAVTPSVQADPYAYPAPAAPLDGAVAAPSK